MNDILTITYQHQCGCTRQGELVESRERTKDGVAWIVHPVCIETGVQLVELNRAAS